MPRIYHTGDGLSVIGSNPFTTHGSWFAVLPSCHLAVSDLEHLGDILSPSLTGRWRGEDDPSGAGGNAAFQHSVGADRAFHAEGWHGRHVCLRRHTVRHDPYRARLHLSHLRYSGPGHAP